MNKSRGVDAETTSIGRGPLGFDVEMARKHGWTDQLIDDAWEEWSRIYERYSTILNRERPDLFAIGGDGEIVHCDPHHPIKGDTAFRRVDIQAAVAGSHTLVVDAYAVGPFAAHPSIKQEEAPYDGSMWSVTHVPSCLALPTGVIDKCEALRLICHLDRILGELGAVVHTSADAQAIAQSVCGQVLNYEDIESYEGENGELVEKQGAIW